MSLPANRSHGSFPSVGATRQHSSHPPSPLRLDPCTRCCLVEMAPKTRPANVQASKQKGQLWDRVSVCALFYLSVWAQPEASQTQIPPMYSWAVGKATLPGAGKASPMFFAIIITVSPHCRAGVGHLQLALAQRPGLAFLFTSKRGGNQSPCMFAFPLGGWTGTMESNLWWKIVVERKKIPRTQSLPKWGREGSSQYTD